mmetsp:Transcript_51054/g.143701  ORF Transcript_51054/g.143701 Transcript_51054/m.143701 type:complete len:375 (-) Transcript_51054:16-1140(-)
MAAAAEESAEDEALLVVAAAEAQVRQFLGVLVYDGAGRLLHLHEGAALGEDVDDEEYLPAAVGDLHQVHGDDLVPVVVGLVVAAVVQPVDLGVVAVDRRDPVALLVVQHGGDVEVDGVGLAGGGAPHGHGEALQRVRLREVDHGALRHRECDALVRGCAGDVCPDDVPDVRLEDVEEVVPHAGGLLDLDQRPGAVLAAPHHRRHDVDVGPARLDGEPLPGGPVVRLVDLDHPVRGVAEVPVVGSDDEDDHLDAVGELLEVHPDGLTEVLSRLVLVDLVPGVPDRPVHGQEVVVVHGIDYDALRVYDDGLEVQVGALAQDVPVDCHAIPLLLQWESKLCAPIHLQRSRPPKWHRSWNEGGVTLTPGLAVPSACHD